MMSNLSFVLFRPKCGASSSGSNLRIVLNGFQSPRRYRSARKQMPLRLCCGFSVARVDEVMELKKWTAVLFGDRGWWETLNISPEHNTEVDGATIPSLTVMEHMLFLYKSSLFRRLVGWPHDGSYDWERSSCSNVCCWRSASLLPLAHDLLLASLQHGYEATLISQKEQWSRAERGNLNGSQYACEVIVFLLRSVFFAFDEECEQKNNAYALSIEKKKHTIQSSTKKLSDNIKLINLLLSPIQDDNLHGHPGGRRTQLLELYFRHFRETPLSIELSAALLRLPVLPVYPLLRMILLRTIHDHFFLNDASFSTTQNIAASAAGLFVALATALLNNDMLFMPLNEDMNDTNMQDSATFLDSFSSIHQLLISELIQAIPLWATLVPSVAHYYGFYAYQHPRHVTRSCDNAGGVPRLPDIRALRRAPLPPPSPHFFQVFNRHIRWIPLMQKLSRVYTKTGRGMELLEVQTNLLHTLPDVEVRWPCSFFVRVIGALLDVYKEPSEWTERVCPSSQKRKGFEGWRSIRNVAKQALSLFHGCNRRDERSIWLVLCKAALTLAPLRFSCQRLLEAYQTVSFVTKGVSTAVNSEPPPVTVDTAALQQMIRLVRGVLVLSSSCPRTTDGEADPMNNALEYAGTIFSLLEDFVRDYAPSSNGSMAVRQSWSEWWIENGVFLVEDLWTVFQMDALPLAKSFIDTLTAHTEPVKEVSRHSAATVSEHAEERSVWSLLRQRSSWRKPLKCFGLLSESSTEKPVPEERDKGNNSSLAFEGDVIPYLWRCNACLEIQDSAPSPAFESQCKYCQAPMHPNADSESKKSLLQNEFSFGKHCNNRTLQFSAARWRCGCGECNSAAHIHCSTCTSAKHITQGCHTDLQNAFTCFHCKEIINTFCCDTVELTESIVSHHSTAPYVLNESDTEKKSRKLRPFCLHLCPLCCTPHPRDQVLLHHCAHPTLSSSLQILKHYECGALTQWTWPLRHHCLLCGEAIPAEMIWRVSGVKKDVRDPFAFYHCGVFQWLNENTLFYCHCNDTSTHPNRFNKTGWHIGYHCPDCLRPRPELLDGTFDIISGKEFNSRVKSTEFYMWQCTRESLDTKSAVSSRIRSIVSDPHLCGQWNYSWMPRCRCCGERRIRSLLEPRAEPAHFMVADNNGGTRGEDVTTSQDCCSSCGRFHLSDACPLYEEY